VSFFAIIVRNQTGDESLWTIFGHDEEEALERFSHEMPEIEVISYDVRVLPIEAAAQFERVEPDMRIVHHSGTWTDLRSGNVATDHPAPYQTTNKIH
jgi:hypothetical protein